METVTSQELSNLRRDDVFLLDVRSKEDFASYHIVESINIPLGTSFGSWAPAIIPQNKTILLIAQDEESALQAEGVLLQLGYGQIKSYFILNEDTRNTVTTLLENFPLLTVQEIYRSLEAKHTRIILDVRSIQEWNAGHIDGASHIEILLLPKVLEKLPRNKPFAVICGSGFRASIGASLLQKNGIKDVCNVQGGMTSWIKEHLPVIKE